MGTMAGLAKSVFSGYKSCLISPKKILDTHPRKKVSWTKEAPAMIQSETQVNQQSMMSKSEF